VSVEAYTGMLHGGLNQYQSAGADAPPASAPSALALDASLEL
jgi:hypothetical protein